MDNNAKNLLNVYFNSDTSAIQNKEKHMEFSLYYCMEDEYKFQFKGSDRPVVRQMLFMFYSIHKHFLGKIQGFWEIFKQNIS